MIQLRFKLADFLFFVHFRCWIILFKIKMYPVNEEQCCYIIINHYQPHGNVNYGCSSGRPSALNPAQVKKLDETIRRNRSATAAKLLTITRFNTFERTIQRYRRSLGYYPRKSVIEVKTNRINEHNRFEFASLHYRANIKRYVF